MNAEVAVCEGRAREVLHSAGDHVEILETPSQFFDALLEGIQTAKSTIDIAALYIGIEGKLEMDFIEALRVAMVDHERPNLKLRLLLDASRATRPCKDREGGTSSTAEVLAQEVLRPAQLWDRQQSKRQSGRVQMSLFQTPHSRTSIRRVLPPRAREIMGVQHIKAFVFDDDVILTGANISSTYLSTRQDRYMVVRQAPQLAEAVRHLLAPIARHSFQLGLREEALQHGLSPGSQPDVDTAQAVALPVPLAEEEGPGPAAQKLLAWQQRGASPFLSRALGAREPKRLLPSYTLRDPEAGCHPFRTPSRFRQSLRDTLSSWSAPEGSQARILTPAMLLFEKGRNRPARLFANHGMGLSIRQGGKQDTQSDAAGSKRPANIHPTDSNGDTLIFPTIQAGFLGLVQDEAATLSALKCLAETERSVPHKGSIAISTPYLNLSRPLLSMLSPLQSLGRARGQASGLGLTLLTSSPEANGFWGSRGLSRHIPLAYAALEARMWRRLTGTSSAVVGGRTLFPFTRKNNNIPDSRCGPRTLLEYARPGWEFHAKGLWYFNSPFVLGESALSQQDEAKTPSSHHQQATSSPRESFVNFSVIGSSNFGGRSQVRDLEAQFFIVTRNAALQKALGKEFQALVAHAYNVSPDKLREPARRASPFIRGLVRLLKSFL